MTDGAIIQGDTMDLMAMQKTFSIALSRQFSPEARIVVYCIVDDELITDSMTFYVTDTTLKQVRAVGSLWYGVLAVCVHV